MPSPTRIPVLSNKGFKKEEKLFHKVDKQVSCKQKLNKQLKLNPIIKMPKVSKNLTCVPTVGNNIKAISKFAENSCTKNLKSGADRRGISEIKRYF